MLEVPPRPTTLTLYPRSCYIVDYTSARTIELLYKFPYILAFLMLDPSSLNYLIELKISKDNKLSELQGLLESYKYHNEDAYYKIIEDLIEYKNNKSELSKKE